MKITIFTTFIFVLIASTFAKKGCFKPCTRQYDPVCGFNGEQYKIFSNKCLMENEHCLDGHEWYTTRMAECDEYKSMKKNCEKPCTLELNPVCGFNGEQYQVFPNECALKNANCRNGKKWMEMRMNNCDNTQQNSVSEESKICETPCTREYNPVCATADGEHFTIFSNPCLLKNQHCQDGKRWLQVRSSNCAVENNLNNEITEKECSQICPLNLDPVCAFDGQEYRIFDNDCIMESVSCMENKHFSIASRSFCKMDNYLNVNCETPCTREYSPVCGFDGDKYEIFSNECEMKNKHCKDGQHWTRTVMSHCSTEMNEY